MDVPAPVLVGRGADGGDASAAQDLLGDLDDVARLYREEALSVRRLVLAAVQAPPALVEDACQIAWTRLVIHRARLRRCTARAWLVRVAVREVFRALDRGRREPSLEAILEAAPCPVSEQAASTGLSPPGPSTDDLLERRARIDLIRSLPERQRRLVWLQGLGLSYREMSGETGMTRRTVERQLLRARSSLAKASA